MGVVWKSIADRRSFLSRISAALLLVVGGAGAVAAQVPTPRQVDRVDGVENFGRVSRTYFRGGAATPDGIERLKQGRVNGRIVACY